MQGVSARGEEEIRKLVLRHAGGRRVPARLRVVTDTTDFFRVDAGDILSLDERLFLVRGTEREGRFGIDDEPKHWVKRAIDLDTGETKIVKLSFRESYRSQVGNLSFDCVRSPAKEARLIGLVRGDPRFMQGYAVADAAGNIVRILDFIPGANLGAAVAEEADDHESYYRKRLPHYLDLFREAAGAIGFLHDHGEKHGDIRRDHLIIERTGGRGVWIDLDFNFHHDGSPFGYDLFGLGNVLVFLVGGGDVTTRYLQEMGGEAPHGLSSDDVNIVFPYRLVNLRKVYPYVSASLNRVLMHFSRRAEIFYEEVDDLLEDLAAAEL